MTRHTATPPTDDEPNPNLDRKIDLYDLDVTISTATTTPGDHLKARSDVAEIIHQQMPGRTLHLRRVAPLLREWAKERHYDVEYIDINGERIYEGDVLYDLPLDVDEIVSELESDD